MKCQGMIAGLNIYLLRKTEIKNSAPCAVLVYRIIVVIRPDDQLVINECKIIDTSAFASERPLVNTFVLGIFERDFIFVR